VGPWNHVLDGGPDPLGEGAIFGVIQSIEIIVSQSCIVHCNTINSGISVTAAANRIATNWLVSQQIRDRETWMRLTEKQLIAEIW